MLGIGTARVADGRPVEEMLRWAFEAGYRHVDTAKLYGNETGVGKAVRESGLKRADIWVTTKLYPTDFDQPRRALEGSLARLGLDHVDLYLIHWPTPEPIPGFDEKLWNEMERFAEEGLAKSIGVSNYDEERLETIIKSANIPPAVNQVKCSPFSYPKALHSFCGKNNIALEGYEPLALGNRQNHPLLAELSITYHKSPAQIMLRWALQKDIITIPKSQHHDRIRENAELYDFMLNNSDMARLDSL